jgi:hypothetical protein|tara:strand:+ start:1644 stop:1853 length:210 start_codon:yes stop_codon:yes gene_type:complete
MTIEIEILALLSPSGFEKRFHKNCQKSKTYYDAYELTEQEYEKNFGKRRYASYDSFRVTKNRKNRNKVT